jgi:hypothetical protein
MLRIAGLALLFVIGAATPAEANDGDAGERTATVRHQRTADPGPKPSVQERTTPVQLPKALSIAPLALQGTLSTGFRHELMTPAAGLAALPLARRAGDDLAWVSQGKSGLELPVTERLSFAVGYRYLEGEDLWRWYAEAGSVDYESHDFMLRACWRF